MSEDLNLDNIISPDEENLIGELTPALYWEWRTSVEEIKTARLEQKNVALAKELRLKEIEIKQLMVKLFDQTVQQKNTEFKNVMERYDVMKKRLEEHIGHEFKNVTVDDITYQVRKIDSTEANS